MTPRTDDQWILSRARDRRVGSEPRKRIPAELPDQLRRNGRDVGFSHCNHATRTSAGLMRLESLAQSHFDCPVVLFSLIAELIGAKVIPADA